MSAGTTGPSEARITEWRWANERGKQGLITVDEAEYFGYAKVAEHPMYPGSWLMRRDG